MTFSHPSISFVTPRAVKLTWKTILNPFHTLFAPRRIEFCVNTPDADSLYRVAIEVIGRGAVPIAVSSGDSGDEPGSDGVGAGHQRFGINNGVFVRTTSEECGAEKEEENEGR